VQNFIDRQKSWKMAGGRRNKQNLAQKVAKQFSDSKAKSQASEDEDSEDEEVPAVKAVNKMASLQMYSSSEEEDEEEEEAEAEIEEGEPTNISIEGAEGNNDVTMAEKEKGLGDEKAPTSEKNKKKKNNKKKKGKSRAKNNSNNKGSPACQETSEVEDEAATNYNHLVGREVEVVGTSRAELNGKRGKVIDFNVNKQRYNVELNHLPIIIALKRENIVDAFEIDRYVCVCLCMYCPLPHIYALSFIFIFSLYLSLALI
jgi:hypothetical protein